MFGIYPWKGIVIRFGIHFREWMLIWSNLRTRSYRMSVVELQYKINQQEFNQMEGTTNSFTSYAHHPTFPYCNPYFPYYQYFLQTATQNVNFAYNQYSSGFNLTVQNCQSPHSNTIHFEPPTPSPPTDHSISIQGQNHKKRSIRNKKNAPAKLIQKLVPKKEGKQKQNRNVCSNILRSFFRKINEDKNVSDLVQRIISKRSLSITGKQFFEYFKQLKINYFKYLRFKKLRHLFVGQELPQHNLIFRILFEHFKTQDFLPYILTSKKIGKWSISFHLRGGRELSEKILD